MVQRIMFINQLLVQLKVRLLNKYEDAIAWLDKGLAIKPQFVNFLSDKGRLVNNLIVRRLFINYLLIQLKIRLLEQYDESLNLLDQALSINHQHKFSLSSKGDCLYSINFILFIRDQQRYKEAIIYYEQSLKIDQNDQYTINQMEFCEMKLKQ